MPVNGIELKEGQIWLDAEGNQRTLSKRNHPIYMWVGIGDGGKWVPYTCDGTSYDGRSSVIDLITLVSEKEAHSCPEEYCIREVIPQNAEDSADKEEVKEEPRYTVEEVFYAIKEHCGKYDSPLGCEFEIKNLLKRFDEDPKYKEYLRLKAIYE